MKRVSFQSVVVGAFGAALLAVAAGCGEDPAAPPHGGAIAVWGGPGRTDGLFHAPRAAAHDRDRLYIVDKTGRIQVFDLGGRWRATWILPKFDKGFPSGLGVRADGALGVADTHNYVVRVYDPEGIEIMVFGREGGEPGEFTYLTDVEFDGEGRLYVCEHGRRDRIQKFDPDGRFLLQWGDTGEEPGEFHRPQALAVDGDGNVYVADAGNHRVQKFTPDGEFLAVFGSPGDAPGEMLYPYDLAISAEGDLVVCEYGNNRVQVFDRSGRGIAILGKAGREEGELATPWAVCCVPDRGIYVLDTGNHRVQVFPMPRSDRAGSETG